MSASNRSMELQLQTFTDASVNDDSVYFQTPFHHLHRQNANQTFQWFGTDQPERFNREAQYTDQSISYVFNSHGYRCEELKPAPVLVIGCSFTFGIGLKLEETWGHQVSTALQVPYMNVGYQGASITYMSRTLMKVFDVVQPKLVLALIPYNHRFEFVSSEPGHPLKVWSKSGINSQHYTGHNKDRAYSYELFTSREQEDFHLVQGIYSINQFLNANGCQFAWNAWEYTETQTPYFQKLIQNSDVGNYWPSDVFNNQIRWKDLKNKARDSSHPGREFHEKYAAFVLNKIKETGLL